MMPREITTKSFQEEVLDSKIPVLLECWASWCLPCKQIDPTLERLSEKYEGKCKILKINIDKNPNISKRYEVKGLPTFITFINGKLLDKQLFEMIEKTQDYDGNKKYKKGLKI